MQKNHVSTLAKNVRALTEGRTEPLYFVITDASAKGQASSCFPKFALANDTAQVEVSGFWVFNGLEVAWAKSTDMNKIATKRADPAISITYGKAPKKADDGDAAEATPSGVTTNAPIATGTAAVVHPANPEWLLKAVANNKAILDSPTRPLEGDIEQYEKRLQAAQLHENASEDIAFLIVTIYKAYEALSINSKDIYAKSDHPCNTEAFREIVKPAKAGAPLNHLNEVDFAKGHYAVEFGYEQEAAKGKPAASVVYPQPRVNVYVKWAGGLKSESVPRAPALHKDFNKMAERDRALRLSMWPEFKEGVFLKTDEKDIVNGKAVAGLGGKSFNEATMGEFLTHGSLMRGSITFDMSIAGTGVSLKPHMHSVHIVRAPRVARANQVGDASFDDDDGIVEGGPSVSHAGPSRVNDSASMISAMSEITVGEPKGLEAADV
jgi:hypothetical protein